ncbi:4Fe-4S dicluster domain-containing protein [Desulforhopalus singaporensis]|uniref:Fe-S-cluster-containing dehydrogenase component n=1 Tax=Desulforhopalus singaporensis TaxID=91360 RepID=A0A1H0TBD7_9BACT|nr:4Fe-4S dicluster domain-containing protein [Desulforhopalus singaporensis]SDP50918.1 Fe-S-cluster-containing dehydrogenase component [Desulforhopalus singaporensis]
MTQYGMIIDLRKCVGCGACALACKTENNTALRRNGQTHNWADFIHETTGTFPDTKFRTLPVLCNHCSNAPCVAACPVEPKAMYKTADGITMHNDDRCIGCRACQDACPYSMDDVSTDGASREYSVISYNDEGEPAHPFFSDKTELIKRCSGSPAELCSLAGAVPPHRTDYQHPDYKNVRRDNIVEKCILCDHRLKVGELPACVEACPSGARIFGDLDDGKSEAAMLLQKHGGFVLKKEKGTKPNVHYIRNYSAR